MTVPAQSELFNSSTANGATTSFPYTFMILSEDDIVVMKDGVIQTSGFTITGVGSTSGGAVVFSVAPANGVIVNRYLDVSLERATDYQQFGDWTADAVNADMDRIILGMQSLDRKIERAIKLPSNTSGDQTLAETAAERAGTVVGFDGDGAMALLEGQAGTSLVDLSASNGASLVGFLQAGTGATARTVQAKLRDAFSVKDFGATGDGVTNDAAAIQACFTAAVAAGKAVVFPAGTYLCGAKISTSGASVAVQGAGVGVTKVVFTATTGGFEFALDAQGAGVPPDQLYFDGMTIESQAAVSTPALSATWATYQPNAQGQAWVRNVNIVRKADGTGSFTDGIKLNKCIVGFISNVVILGDDARVSARGISLIDCVGIRVTDFDINRYAMGVSVTKVSATQTEGVFLTNGFIYDINKGIFVDTAIHINISGTHVNINGAAAEYAVRLVSVAQSVISDGCLIYFGGEVGDAANQDGIQLDTCNSVNIGGSTIVGITKANTRYAAVLTDSDYNTVTTNNISNATTGLFVSSATSDNNMLLGNGFYGCTANITDSGTLTYRGSNVDLDTGAALDSLRWGAAHGSFGVGELSTDANWGGYLRGRSGSVGDIGLADSADVVCGVVKSGSFRVKEYAKASLPSVTAAGGGLIVVSDDVGGYTLAFCDGTNWRRVSDRAIVS